LASLVTRIRRNAPIVADAATAEHCCPACAKPVWTDDHAVRIHGERYHAQCALYRPKAAGAARR
jgi:hypothetical protein